MVDVELLKQYIDTSGVSVTHIATAAGMSRETFYKRLANPTFRVSEVQSISETLHLSKDDFMRIFFAKNVN